MRTCLQQEKCKRYLFYEVDTTRYTILYNKVNVIEYNLLEIRYCVVPSVSLNKLKLS